MARPGTASHTRSRIGWRTRCSRTTRRERGLSTARTARSGSAGTRRDPAALTVRSTARTVAAVTSLHSSRLARDERRDQLIRMGVELLGRRPYDQISITQLAQAAGISKGLLYHYFATKSDFVVAVLRQSRGQLEQRLTFDPSLEPAARLDAGLETFLNFVEEHAAGFKA